MILTLLGLAITTGIAAIGILTNNVGPKLKWILLLLTLAGALVAGGSAWEERNGKERAEARAKASEDKLKDLAGTLSLVRITVGELARLDDLSGGSKYYVRIAADTSRERLEGYLRSIESTYKGARTSSLVTIRPPRVGSRNFELVFGQQLDVAAAEVFHRLATSHRLPPPGQIAYILPEPASQQ